MRFILADTELLKYTPIDPDSDAQDWLETSKPKRKI